MKETHYKLKQRVTALFAAAVMLCSMLPGAAFAEEPTPQPTEETVQMEQQTEPSETDNGQTDESSPDPGEDVTEATPETAEEQPAEEEISAAVVGAELYTDLPDTPIGSYIGSEGLPVATGETKIGISEWPESQLEETSDSYLTAAALDNDGLTMAAPLLDGADYAIVPIMAQVEYPADGSSTDMILPDGVTLLDFYGEPATDADALLHNSYHETSAAVMGVYVQAAADFNAQLVYTGSDGSIVQEIYANWEAPAQTASGSFDFDYGIITNKVQLKTTEKVDGATIEIEPITKSGTIDGGTWNISPADKQSVTTAGHTNDDNFQNNGGAASASWTLHYSVSKTTDSRNGRVGPYTTQDEADAAADSARDAAIAELQGEAQRMVDNAVASAKAEVANVKFRYEEVGVPYGFEMYWGSNGSNQTISVPANSNNAYLMKNDEWSLQVNIKKTDSETGNQIAADAQYEIFQWDTVTGKYQPTGGYNTYSVQRQGDGTYAVINSAAYATTDSMRHTLYYTQRNTGKFIIVESKAPKGYFGDWTDINHPGMANTPLGKRGYYIEITEDSDNSVIWLDNAGRSGPQERPPQRYCAP